MTPHSTPYGYRSYLPIDCCCCFGTCTVAVVVVVCTATLCCWCCKLLFCLSCFVKSWINGGGFGINPTLSTLCTFLSTRWWWRRWKYHQPTLYELIVFIATYANKYIYTYERFQLKVKKKCMDLKQKQIDFCAHVKYVLSKYII